MASEPRAANSATHSHKNDSSKCAAWSSLVKCQWGLITVERKILGKHWSEWRSIYLVFLSTLNYLNPPLVTMSVLFAHFRANT